MREPYAWPHLQCYLEAWRGEQWAVLTVPRLAGEEVAVVVAVVVGVVDDAVRLRCAPFVRPA